MYMPAPTKPGIEPKREKDRVKGDPWHIGPRGKTASRRKGARDPGFTPTEQRTKDRLMKQFCKLEGPGGNSAAYRSASCWCQACFGKRLRAENSLWCPDCGDGQR